LEKHKGSKGEESEQEGRAEGAGGHTQIISQDGSDELSFIVGPSHHVQHVLENK
jgi:hypothetical protein